MKCPDELIMQTVLTKHCEKFKMPREDWEFRGDGILLNNTHFVVSMNDFLTHVRTIDHYCSDCANNIKENENEKE